MVSRDGDVQGMQAAEQPEQKDAANDDNKVQQESETEKREFIRWLKEHNVLDNRFFETYPEKAKPLEWDEEFEKDIYSLYIASLWDENIRDEDLRYLSKCPDLSIIALNTDTTKLSAKGLRHLSGLKTLKCVYFSGARPVPVAWVQSLASFDKFEFWVIRAPVTDESLIALTGSKSAIKNLDIFGATQTHLTAKGYHAIGSLSSLKSFSILFMKPTDSNVGVKLSGKAIHEISRCPNLRDLHITFEDGGVELSAQAAKDIASMPKLQCMTMSCLSAPTEDTLAILGQRKWISIGLNWPTLNAKAKQEDKSPYDMSRQLIEEAASRVSHGNATPSIESKTKDKIIKPEDSKTPE